MKAKFFVIGALAALLIPLTLLAPSVAPHVAAAIPSTWAKTYGGRSEDIPWAVIPASDGGYIVAGQTPSFGAGANEMWLTKLDDLGNAIWQKTYGGGSTASARSIIPTSDGGYIVAGDISSLGVEPGDMWVLKLDGSGNVVWQKTYGGRSWDYATSIIPTSDNSYIVVGHTFSFGAGGYDVWVLKLDSLGNVVWQKTYGGSSHEYAWSSARTSDDGIVVAASTDSFGKGMWLVRLDGQGNVIWQKSYGSFGETPWSITPTSDGGFIVAGQTDAFFSQKREAWVLKLDNLGNVVWQKAYGGWSEDVFSSIRTTSDGGYIVAGYTATFGDALWLVRLDGLGNVIWQKTYGGSAREVAHSVSTTGDGGYIVAGYTLSFGVADIDAWVLKLDANGNIGGSCSLIASSTANVSNSTATVSDTMATVTDTTVIPMASHATATTTSAQVATQCEGEVTLPVKVDIKPGSDVNPINLKSKGVIPVAILSTSSFDASKVETSSVKFGPSGANSTQNSLEDVNGDGRIDLVLHFRTQATGIRGKDTNACLTGETTSGTPLDGCDSIRIR